ncbi:MAG: hypothetical protein U1E14_05125 [Geminicoccaceae bacterium]
MASPLAIRGSFRGYSGGDRTVRGFVQGLLRLGIEVELIDFPLWADLRLPPGQQPLVHRSLAAPERAPVVVQFCLPQQAERFAGRASVNFTMFELDRVPGFWLRHSLQQDHVVVPEASSRAAWLVDGFPPERISLCPLGVDGERFRPGVPALALGEARGRDVAAYRARFLNVSTIIPRKNLLGLLHVWLDATRADDDAVLILKLSHSGLAAARLMRDLHLLERRLGLSRERAAPLLFLDRRLGDDELPGLFAAATHYWSQSHGEGWDQPMTEAAVSGLRLIAPDHTAYRAYLDTTVATLIPAVRAPARRIDLEDDVDPAHYHRQFSAVPYWWVPDHDAAVAAVRSAINRRDEPRSRARERILPFTWEAAAARLAEIVGAVATRSR